MNVVSAFAVAMLLGCAFAATAQDGTLDASFGSAGKRVVAFDALPASPIDAVLDTVVDAQDRIYLIGQVNTADGPRMGVARLTPGGTLDASYGNAGRVVAPAQAGFALTGTSAHVDAGGILLVAGTLTTNGNDDFAVCRFDSNGALAAFANGFQCVKIAFDLGDTNDDVLADMAVGSDGRIVLVGSSAQANQDVYAGLARLKPNGDLDETFKGTGKVTVRGDFGFDRLALNGVKIQANGKIVAVGSGDSEFDVPLSTPIAIRLNVDGTQDSAFGLNGMTILQLLPDQRDGTLEELALVPVSGNLVLDQSFFAVGKRETEVGSERYAGTAFLIRPDGYTDVSFGESGGAVIDSIGSDLALSDVEREGDGGLMVIGTVRGSENSTTGLDFYATRLRRDGTRDVFGFNFPFGYQLVDFGFDGKNDTAQAAVFQRDRLLIAGSVLRTTTLPPDLDFAMIALQRRAIFGDSLE